MTNAAASTTHRYHSAELDLLSLLEVVIARAPKVLKSGLPNLAFTAPPTKRCTPDK